MALVAVGVLAVATVGVFVVRAVTGSGGGASSPEAAIEDLLAALEEEDPVAALAAMDPDEVEALGDVYESAADRATAIGFAPDTTTLGGADIALSGVTYDVEEIGDGVSKVTISDGEADLTVTTGDLGDPTEPGLERPAAVDDEEPDDRIDGELTVDDLVVTNEDGDDEIDPFVVTVRRGGGWYVSPLYTAAQYAVEALGLDAPTLPPPDAGEGADDPEAAVRDLLVGAGDVDGEAIGDLAAGATGDAVRAYSGALEELVGRAGEDTSADIDVLETDVSDRAAGGQRVTVTRLEGTLSYTDEDGDDQVAEVTWDGTCLDVDVRRQDDEGSSGSMTDGDQEGRVATSDLCLTDGWEGFGIDSLSVVAVEEDGSWRIDPLATLTDYAAAIVPELDGDTILRVLDYPELAEPAASVAVGSPTEVDLNEAGYAVVTLDVEAGQGFTISTELEDGVDDELQAFLVTPDGEYESAFSLVEPDESGQYVLVLAKDGFSPSTASVRVSPLVRRDLVVGEAASGGIGQPGDIVEYSVDLEADAAYELMFNVPDLSYSVIDPDGRALDLIELDEGRASLVTDQAGTYGVRVDGGVEEATGSFRVNVVEVPPFVLGNGSSAEATGMILAPGDSQFIDFTVQGGAEVAIDVVPDDGAFDPVFLVGDPATNTELARFDSGGPGEPESVSFAPDEATTYRLEVQGADDTVGSFSVTAALIP